MFIFILILNVILILILEKNVFKLHSDFEIQPDHSIPARKLNQQEEMVSLFNGISTLFRLFNAKAILLEEQ